MNRTHTHTLVGLALTVGLVAGTAATATAAPLEQLGSGPDAGGVVLPTADTTTVSRTTGVGGTARGGDGAFWQYGVSGGDVWSNYFRERSCHGATAVGKKTKRVTNVPGGRYAYAATPKAGSGNQAYYHNC